MLNLMLTYILSIWCPKCHDAIMSITVFKILSPSVKLKRTVGLSPPIDFQMLSGSWNCATTVVVTETPNYVHQGCWPLWGICRDRFEATTACSPIPDIRDISQHVQYILEMQSAQGRNTLLQLTVRLLLGNYGIRLPAKRLNECDYGHSSTSPVFFRYMVTCWWHTAQIRSGISMVNWLQIYVIYAYVALRHIPYSINQTYLLSPLGIPFSGPRPGIKEL